MSFKDFFSASADKYARFRPSYPETLFAYLSSLTEQHDGAWDCATGNGQAAVLLTKYYDRIFATDLSENQLRYAKLHDRIEYMISAAEDSGLPTHSVDLITVAQAFHWFDQNLFVDEVKRVGKKNGILAIWCYGLVTIAPDIDSVVKYLYEDILGSFWDTARKLVDSNYESITLPFTTVPSPTFSMNVSWTFDHFIGYLKTWSALQKFMIENNVDPLSKLIPELASLWSPLPSRQGKWLIKPKVWRI